MNLFEIKLHIRLFSEMSFKEVPVEIGRLIDAALAKDAKWLTFHEKNQFKNYCFGGIYLSADGGNTKIGKVYTLAIRTLEIELTSYFSENLVGTKTNVMQAVSMDLKINSFARPIEKIYSLTPVIVKNDNGYWKGHLSLEEYEKRIFENLIKKYNALHEEKMDENFAFSTSFAFTNKKPISFPYKNIKLLGDKIEIMIETNDRAQELAKVAIACGVGELNARGAGFVLYKTI